MKLNLLFVTIALSFFLSEVYVCNAQYEIVVKGVSFAFQAAAKKAFKELFKEKDPDHHGEQMKKLNEVTKKIQSLEKKMVGHFREVLNEVKNIPNTTVHSHIATEFENALIGIQSHVRDLVQKKKQVDRNELTVDYHVRGEVDALKNNLRTFKNQLETIMTKKDISYDFVLQVMNLANVCKDGMSQVQLLDSFRALYFNAMSKYLIGQHIGILLWEKHDNKRLGDKKKAINVEVRDQLLNYGKRFQELMKKSSREYQDCTEKPDYHTIREEKVAVPRKCFIAGDDKKIVSFDDVNYKLPPWCEAYVSLRPVKARAGYVVVGAQIAHNENIAYIKIIEGKVLPGGIIDPDTIDYSEDPAPGVGAEVFHLADSRPIFDLTKAIASGDRVLTGLGFKVTEEKHVYLDVIAQNLNVQDGILDPNTERSETHEKATSEYHVKRYNIENFNKTLRNGLGLQPVKPNQYASLYPSPLAYSNYKFQVVHSPVFDASDVFPTPVTLLSGAGLFVNQVKGTRGFLSIRLFTFDIAPHVTNVDFDVEHEFFQDVIKNI